MDLVRARRLAEELTGNTVGAWLIERLIGWGKSAVVLRAKRGDQAGALKVFDPELVERYGLEVQRARVEREMTLADHPHPNIVRILDGGVCPRTSLLYLVMEEIDGPSLRELVATLPRDRILPLLEQLASAALHLETLQLVHRDIKPANVVATEESSHLTLLDLGVLRPIGASELTDSTSGQPFVGTLRYSSPEYLLRQEEDTTEGWRALTFYQIGGVLHDMIMRRPLFHHINEPFARLVQAVATEPPQIEAPDVPEYLIRLATHCLVKDPGIRVRLVSWQSFAPSTDLSTDWRKLLWQRVQSRLLSTGTPPAASQADQQRQRAKEAGLQLLQRCIRSVCIDNELCPPITLRAWHDGDHLGHAVIFAKGGKHGLQHWLKLIYIVEVLDVQPLIVQIGAAAVILLDEAMASVPQTWHVVYEGVADGSSEKEAIAGFIYYSLDRALETILDSDEFWLPAPSVVNGANGSELRPSDE